MEILDGALLLTLTSFLLLVIINVAKAYRDTKGKYSPLTLSVFVSLALAVVTPIFFCFPLLWIYKWIINLYLKVKHGSNFVAMVRGADVLYSSDSHENSRICCLLVLEISDKMSVDDLFDSLKEVVYRNCLQDNKKLYKFQSVLHECGGYLYLLKENVTVNDCVKKLRTIEKCDQLSEEDLLRLVGECKDAPLPKNNTILWEFSLGTQSIRWVNDAKTNMKYYPLVLRTHHAICDGFSFSQFLFGVMSDKSEQVKVRPEVYLSKTKDRPLLLDILTTAFLTLYSFLYSPSVIVQTFVFKENEINIFCGPKLNNVDVMAMKVDEGEYFQKLQRIKSSVKGVNFSNILFAAYSYSLQEHFQKHSYSQPKYLKVVVPYLRKAAFLPQMPTGHLTMKDVTLENTATLLTLELPICFPKDTSLLQRLRHIQKLTSELPTSTNNKIFYFASHLAIQLLPLPLLKLFDHSLQWSAVISILPGTSRVLFGNGKISLKDMIFWVPHMKKIGCNFSLFTYSKKIQIATNIDTALIRDKTSAQSILDGIFEYIKLLEEDIQKRTI
ncbi:hypothetical protein FQA39_LY12488 [Lamprigera yunnana]|nr:hypothetical protein FQA39_LY12488 [Lamprigera yunnana]